MPAELKAVDRLLDDAAFFEPFRAHFHSVLGRPSVPIETYLRLMFLKYRYRLGFEPLCREVADSISWQRFCRIPLGVAVPHPTTLMKITTRCGSSAVEGLNEALLARALAAKVLKTNRVRADTTVVPANVAYPTDSGLLAKGVAKLAGVERMRQGAERFGIPWPRYRLIGLLEMAAAAGILVGLDWRPLGIAAGIGTGALMIGALAYHRHARDPLPDMTGAVVTLALAIGYLVTAFSLSAGGLP
jgi:uncharacterized membrane protein YphA (DoxX/SURF4 family)